MGSSIKKNYIYNVSFQIFSLLIPFITTPYISRVLQPEGVGTYSYANSIATYFSLMAALGLASYGLREVSRVRDNKEAASKLFWELTLIRVVSTLVCCLLYLAACLVFANDLRVYLVSGLVVVTVGVDCSWFFQAMENFKALTIRNFAIKLVSILCIFLFVKTQDDLLLYIFIHAGGTLLANIAMWPQLRRWIVFIPFRQLTFRRHIKETLVYFIPTIATSVYTVLDRAMIGVITKDMAQNGFYEQAHKIVNMLMTVITSLNVVVGVRTSYLFGQDRHDEIRKHIHDTFRFMFMVSMPLAAGLIACARDFVPSFFGPGYDEVAPMLMMFAPLLFIIGISNVLGTLYLTPSGQRARSNRAIIAGAVCNFLLNIVLIHFFGAYGAVVASVVAELLISALYLSYSKDFIHLGPVIGQGLRYALFAGVMFVPTYFMGRWLPRGWETIVIQIAVGVIVYSAELILTRDPAWLEAKKMLFKKIKKS